MKTVSIKKLVKLGLISSSDAENIERLSSLHQKYLSKRPVPSIEAPGYYFFDGTQIYKFEVPSNCEVKVYARKKK